MSRIPILSVAAALLVAGCGTVHVPLPKITAQKVSVPMPVYCKPALPPEPVYPDSDEALAAAQDVFEGVKLLKAGRQLRIAYTALYLTALKGCEGPPTAAPK